MLYLLEALLLIHCSLSGILKTPIHRLQMSQVFSALDQPKVGMDVEDKGLLEASSGATLTTKAKKSSASSMSTSALPWKSPLSERRRLPNLNAFKSQLER